MSLRKNILFFVILVLFLWGYSCRRNSESWTTFQRIDLNLENTIIGDGSKVKGDAHSGDFFSRMTGQGAFGCGFYYTYPKSLFDNQVRVVVEGWARSNMPQSKGSIVVSLTNHDSVINWSPMNLAMAITEPNKWVHFKDSIVLNKKYGGFQYTAMSVYGYLGNSAANESFDLDDFTVTLKLLN